MTLHFLLVSGACTTNCGHGKASVSVEGRSPVYVAETWPWQERVTAMSYFGPPLTRAEYEHQCMPKVTQTTRHGGTWTRSDPPDRDVISHETLAPPSKEQDYLSEGIIFRFDGQCYDLETLNQWIESQTYGGLDPSVPHTRRPFTPAELQDLRDWTYGRKLPDDQVQALRNRSLEVKDAMQKAVATPGFEDAPGWQEAYDKLSLQMKRIEEEQQSQSRQNYSIPVDISSNIKDAIILMTELMSRRSTHLKRRLTEQRLVWDREKQLRVAAGGLAGPGPKRGRESL